MKSCPYEILGLTKTATNEEIKRAYKKLAFLYHPDKNNHLSEDEHRKCEEEFKKVNNAYRKLTDPNYSPDNDAFFSSSFRGKIPEWMYSLFDKFELSENTFSNVMYDIKNLTEYYRLNTNKKKVAPTLYFHVNCSLEDIYNGVTKELNITVQKKCTKCMGLGKKIIQDRSIYEDAYIFAPNLHSMGLLTKRDFENYKNMFSLMEKLVRGPDIMIYLRSSISKLVENIHRRGREFENSISIDYLSRLNERYEAWVQNYDKGKIISIDVDKVNFVDEPKDFGNVINLIDKEINGLF